MHILFLSDNFPPEGNAPAARTFEHCRAWVRAGARVTVITGQPNFPTGRLHPGYRNALWAREVIEGVEVVRVWTYMAANAGRIRRSLDYASFMAAAAVAGLLVRRPDVVVATSPQILTACAGAAVAALRAAPFVFELRDLWPASIRAVGALRSSFLLAALERLELFLYSRSAAVVAVTRAFRADLIARGVPAGKITVVRNGADLARFRPRPRDEALAAALGLKGAFVAGYIGGHGMAHGLGVVLDAATRLADREPHIHFLMIGGGAEREALARRAAALGLANVVFAGPVPRPEIERYWSLLDCAMIHLRPDPLFRTVIPSKLFEAMAMGLPVLHAVPGESAELVDEAGAGLVIPPEDPAAMADAVLTLAAASGMRTAFARRSREAALRHGRDDRAAEMLSVLEAVAAAARRPRPARGGLADARA